MTAKNQIDESEPVLVRLRDRRDVRNATDDEVEMDARQRRHGDCRRQYIVYGDEKYYVR